MPRWWGWRLCPPPPLLAADEGGAHGAQILAALKGTPSEREAPRDILVNRPDYVVFVPRQPRDPKLRDPKKPGDTYNDHFQVIEDEKRGLLYAFWTQASREGAIDQHIAFSKSADRGRTWSAPKLLCDRDGGKPFLHPRSPVPFYDWKSPKAGSGTYFALIHNAFDFNGKTAYQRRGPLYLIAGTFMPTAEQPVWFKEPKLFAPREDGNSFYTSSLVLDGKGVLWYNDKKFYLCGRVIGPEWFDRLDLKERNNRYEEKTANGIPRCLRVRGFCRARVGRTSQDACVVSL